MQSPRPSLTDSKPVEPVVVTPEVAGLEAIRLKIIQIMEDRFSEYSNAHLLWSNREEHIAKPILETDPLAIQFFKRLLLVLQGAEQAMKLIQSLNEKEFKLQVHLLPEMYELSKVLYKNLIKEIKELAVIAKQAKIPTSALRSLTSIQTNLAVLSADNMSGQKMLQHIGEQLTFSSTVMTDALSTLVDSYFDTRVPAPIIPGTGHELPASVPASEEKGEAPRVWLGTIGTLDNIRNGVSFITDKLEGHLSEISSRPEEKAKPISTQEAASRALLRETAEALSSEDIDEEGYLTYADTETPLSQSLKAITNIFWAINEMGRGNFLSKSKAAYNAKIHYGKIDWSGISSDTKEIVERLLDSILILAKDRVEPTLVSLTKETHEMELANGLRYGTLLQGIRPLGIEEIYLARGISLTNPLGAVEEEKEFTTRIEQLDFNSDESEKESKEVEDFHSLYQRYLTLGQLMNAGEKSALGQVAAQAFLFKVPIPAWPSYITGLGDVWDKFTADAIYKPGAMLADLAATTAVGLAEKIKAYYSDFPHDELLLALVKHKGISDEEALKQLKIQNEEKLQIQHEDSVKELKIQYNKAVNKSPTPSEEAISELKNNYQTTLEKLQSQHEVDKVELPTPNKKAVDDFKINYDKNLEKLQSHLIKQMKPKARIILSSQLPPLKKLKESESRGELTRSEKLQKELLKFIEADRAEAKSRATKTYKTKMVSDLGKGVVSMVSSLASTVKKATSSTPALDLDPTPDFKAIANIQHSRRKHLADKELEFNALKEASETHRSVKLEFAVNLLREKGISSLLRPTLATPDEKDEKLNRSSKRLLAVIEADIMGISRRDALHAYHDKAISLASRPARLARESKDATPRPLITMISKLYESKEPDIKSVAHSAAVETILAGYTQQAEWKPLEILTPLNRHDLIHALELPELYSLITDYYKEKGSPELDEKRAEVAERFSLFNKLLTVADGKITDVDPPRDKAAWVNFLKEQYKKLEAKPQDNELRNKIGKFLGRLAVADKEIARIIMVQPEAKGLLLHECVEVKVIDKVSPDEALYHEVVVNGLVSQKVKDNKFESICNENAGLMLQMHKTQNPRSLPRQSESDILSLYRESPWALCKLIEEFRRKKISRNSEAERNLNQLFANIVFSDKGKEIRYEILKQATQEDRAKFLNLLTGSNNAKFWVIAKEDIRSSPQINIANLFKPFLQNSLIMEVPILKEDIEEKQQRFYDNLIAISVELEGKADSYLGVISAEKKIKDLELEAIKCCKDISDKVEFIVNNPTLLDAVNFAINILQSYINEKQGDLGNIFSAHRQENLKLCKQGISDYTSLQEKLVSAVKEGDLTNHAVEFNQIGERIKQNHSALLVKYEHISHSVLKKRIDLIPKQEIKPSANSPDFKRSGAPEVRSANKLTNQTSSFGSIALQVGLIALITYHMRQLFLGLLKYSTSDQEPDNQRGVGRR